MLRVTCECRKILVVKDEHAGKRVRCPGCGKTTQVPAAPPTVLPPKAADRLPPKRDTLPVVGQQVEAASSPPVIQTENRSPSKVHPGRHESGFSAAFKSLKFWILASSGGGVFLVLLAGYLLWTRLPIDGVRRQSPGPWQITLIHDLSIAPAKQGHLVQLAATDYVEIGDNFTWIKVRFQEPSDAGVVGRFQCVKGSSVVGKLHAFAIGETLVNARWNEETEKGRAKSQANEPAGDSLFGDLLLGRYPRQPGEVLLIFRGNLKGQTGLRLTLDDFSQPL